MLEVSKQTCLRRKSERRSFLEAIKVEVIGCNRRLSEIENVPAEAQITDARSAVYGEGRNAYREERKSNYAFKRTADLALRSNQPFAPQPLNAALGLFRNYGPSSQVVAKATSMCYNSGQD